jgi:hypothetical protein
MMAALLIILVLLATPVFAGTITLTDGFAGADNRNTFVGFVGTRGFTVSGVVGKFTGSSTAFIACGLADFPPLDNRCRPGQAISLQHTIFGFTPDQGFLGDLTFRSTASLEGQNYTVGLHLKHLLHGATALFRGDLIASHVIAPPLNADRATLT